MRISDTITYYGFRYVIIDGFASEPTLEDVHAIFVHQAVKQIGRFACSDETIDTMWRFGCVIRAMRNLSLIKTEK